MSFSLVFTPRARVQLAAIDDWLSHEASAEVASKFVGAIVERCEKLADFPHRGTPRDDIRPDARTIPFRRRATIAYIVDGEKVVILGVFYRGQDPTDPDIA